MNYNYKIVGKLCSNKLYHQRCQPLEISNLEIFFWTSTLPTLKFFFDLDPPSPPPHKQFCGEKRQSICQGLQLVEYSSRDSHFYRSNKEETLFFLFATNNVHSHSQENEARNCNTSISQIILEFWNILSLNLSFLRATDPNFLLSESFGHPYRRAGDWSCIQETPI